MPIGFDGTLHLAWVPSQQLLRIVRLARAPGHESGGRVAEDLILVVVERNSAVWTVLLNENRAGPWCRLGRQPHRDDRTALSECDAVLEPTRADHLPRTRWHRCKIFFRHLEHPIHAGDTLG